MPKMPGKKSGDKDAANSNSTKVALRAVDGTMRELGEKDLFLETTKHKILKFRTLGKTQFRDKEGEQVRDSLLKPGDQLSVEVNGDDPETAVRVILTHKGTDADRARAERAFDRDSAQTPVEADTHSAGVMETASEPAGASKPGTSGDGDRDRDIPTLARAGKTDQPEPPEPGDSGKIDNGKTVARAAAPDPAGALPKVQVQADDIIGAAREAADQLMDGLPNFLVQQSTTRYFSRSAPPQWQVLDVVTAEVASVNGKEDYRNIMVNGKPSNRPIEKTGAWSTGEFQTTLQSLLNPYTAAAFHKAKDDLLDGRPAYTYDFKVKQENSDWDIHAPDGSKVSPSYTGTVWIDKETSNVMRIEEQTGPMPASFPFDKAESVVEYGFVRLDGKTYPLPVHSDSLTCQRGTTTCTKNDINFRNYRKFGSESTVTFDK